MYGSTTTTTTYEFLVKSKQYISSFKWEELNSDTIVLHVMTPTDQFVHMTVHSIYDNKVCNPSPN